MTRVQPPVALLLAHSSSLICAGKALSRPHGATGLPSPPLRQKRFPPAWSCPPPVLSPLPLSVDATHTMLEGDEPAEPETQTASETQTESEAQAVAQSERVITEQLHDRAWHLSFAVNVDRIRAGGAVCELSPALGPVAGVLGAAAEHQRAGGGGSRLARRRLDREALRPPAAGGHINSWISWYEEMTRRGAIRTGTAAV